MFIYLLSELCLFSESCYVRLYLFFITSRAWIRVIVLLYCVCNTGLQCDKITSHETNLVFVLSTDAIPLLQEPIYRGDKGGHFLPLLPLLLHLLLQAS